MFNTLIHNMTDDLARVISWFFQTFYIRYSNICGYITDDFLPFYVVADQRLSENSYEQPNGGCTYLHPSPALRVHWPSEHEPEWPERDTHTTQTSTSGEARLPSAPYRRRRDDSDVALSSSLQSTQEERQRIRTNWKWNSGIVHAVRGHVCEDAQEELSLWAGLEGSGYDDVAPLRQVNATEHRSRVDVDAPSDLLLGHVHAVDPVQLHLNTEKPAQFGDNLINDNQKYTCMSKTNDYFSNYERDPILTLWMSKPIARFSPRPSLNVALRSFCCRQIKTSSSGLVTSNIYCNRKRKSTNV